MVTMFKKLSLMLAAVCLCSSAFALDIKGLTKKKNKAPQIDVVTWLQQVKDSLPSEVEGVKIFRPNESDNEGKPIVAASLSVGKSDVSDAFVAAYICVKDMFDEESQDAFDDVDYDKHKFSVYREIRQGEYQKAATYRFITDYTFTGGRMSFTTHDINIEYKEKGILPRKVDLVKFKPATNERHRELMESFCLINSRIARDMVKAIRENKNVSITHWAEIKEGRVVKGMNETEVRLIGGSPRTISPLGDKTQWIYNNDFIVIFSDGIVTNAIQ